MQLVLPLQALDLTKSMHRVAAYPLYSLLLLIWPLYGMTSSIRPAAEAPDRDYCRHSSMHTSSSHTRMPSRCVRLSMLSHQLKMLFTL